jgi:hypothetical protein
MIEKLKWLYKPVNIDAIILSKIQTEFINIFNLLYPTVFEDSQFGIHAERFAFLNKDHILEYAPTYINLLKEMNLYNRWRMSGFCATKNYTSKLCTAHIDQIDWIRNSVSFNLPIQNCHNSYTAFYDVGGAGGNEHHDREDIYPNSLRFASDDLKSEIGRISVTQPSFINVTIPHRPVTNHDELRIILCARFTPELFDYDFENFNYLDHSA